MNRFSTSNRALKIELRGAHGAVRTIVLTALFGESRCLVGAWRLAGFRSGEGTIRAFSPVAKGTRH